MQTLDGKSILMVPIDGEMPFLKATIDIIMCSHVTWKEKKEDFLRCILNKPKVVFID